MTFKPDPEEDEEDSVDLLELLLGVVLLVLSFDLARYKEARLIALLLFRMSTLGGLRLLVPVEVLAILDFLLIK